MGFLSPVCVCRAFLTEWFASPCSLCVSGVVSLFYVLSEKSENIQVQDLVKDCSVGDFKMSLRQGKRATGTELWLPTGSSEGIRSLTVTEEPVCWLERHLLLCPYPRLSPGKAAP